MRFLENHDEARAASAFLPVEKHFAAALAMFLAPGLRFFHDGQMVTGLYLDLPAWGYHLFAVLRGE